MTVYRILIQKKRLDSPTASLPGAPAEGRGLAELDSPQGQAHAVSSEADNPQILHCLLPLGLYLFIPLVFLFIIFFLFFSPRLLFQHYQDRLLSCLLLFFLPLCFLPLFSLFPPSSNILFFYIPHTSYIMQYFLLQIL